MNFFEEMTKQGENPDDVRDFILEKNSDVVRTLTEQGESPEDIFSYIQHQTGMPTPIDSNLNQRSPFMQGLDVLGITGEDSLVSNISDTVVPSFSRGLDRTIESAPKVASNIGAGLLKGTAETSDMLLSGYDKINPFMSQQMAKDRQDRRASDLDSIDALADNSDSPEFKTMGFFSPVPEIAVGAKVYSKLKKAPMEFSKFTNTVDDLTDETKTLVEQIKHTDDTFTEKKAFELVKGKPVDEQIVILSEQAGTAGSNILEKGIQLSNKSALKYGKHLTDKVNAVEEAMGKGDILKVEEEASKQFGDMRKVIRATSRNPDKKFDTVGLQNELEELYKMGDTEIAKTRINALQARIETAQSKGAVTVDDVLDIRQRVNYELNKASPTDKIKWKAFKTKIDGFVDEVVSPEMKQFVDEANDTWHKFQTQKDVLAIIDRHTSFLSKGSKIGEFKALDWTRMSKELQEQGFDKKKFPAVDSLMKLSEDYAKKFGDHEVRILGGTRPRSSPAELQTLANTVSGALQVKMVRGVMNKVMAILPSEAGKLAKAEKALSEAIEKGRTPDDVLSLLIKNPNTPDSVKKATAKLKRQTIKDRITAVKNRKRREKATNPKVVAILRDAQESMNKKGLAVEKAMSNLRKKELKLQKMIDDGAEGVEDIYEQVQFLKKELSLRESSYTKATDVFDGKLSHSGYQINDMNKFENPLATKPRSEVTTR